MNANALDDRLAAHCRLLLSNVRLEETLVLKVTLTMRVTHAFSFASLPCLTSAAGQPICPSKVTVEAIAMSADSGETLPNGARRYGHIPQFFDSPHAPPLDLSLPRSPADARITSDEIFAHYRYQQDPPWIYLSARLNYRFDCASECPSEFSVDMRDVATVGDDFSTSGVFVLHKKRSTDYEPAVVLQ